MKKHITAYLCFLCFAGGVFAQDSEDGKIVSKEVVEAKGELKIDELKPRSRVWLDPVEGLDSLIAGRRLELSGEYQEKMESFLFPVLVHCTNYLREPLLSRKVARRIEIDLSGKAKRGYRSWRLRIIDPGGNAVKVFSGKGRPPERLEWNGFTENGEPLRIGTPYACMLDLFGKDTLNLILDHISVSAFAFRTKDGVLIRVNAERAYDPELAKFTPWGEDVVKEVINAAMEEFVRGIDIVIYDDRKDVAEELVRILLEKIKSGLALRQNFIATRTKFPSGEIGGKRVLEIKLKKS